MVKWRFFDGSEPSVCVSLLNGNLKWSEGFGGCTGLVHTNFAIILIIENLFGREPSEPSEPSLLIWGAGIQHLI